MCLTGTQHEVFVATYTTDCSMSPPPCTMEKTNNIGVCQYLLTALQGCTRVVSKPNPRKEGLGDRLGWKCTVHSECRHIPICIYWYSSRRWKIVARVVVGAQLSSYWANRWLEVPEIKWVWTNNYKFHTFQPPSPSFWYFQGSGSETSTMHGIKGVDRCSCNYFNFSKWLQLQLLIESFPKIVIINYFLNTDTDRLFFF